MGSSWHLLLLLPTVVAASGNLRGAPERLLNTVPIPCTQLDVPNWTGTVNSYDTCLEACGLLRAQSLQWANTGGSLTNGNTFIAHQCVCNMPSGEDIRCITVQPEGEPPTGNASGGPPTGAAAGAAAPKYPFGNCFDFGVINIGNCGVWCRYFYGDNLNPKQLVDFTSSTSLGGEQFMKCDCMVEDAPLVTLCQGSRPITPAPTPAPRASGAAAPSTRAPLSYTTRTPRPPTPNPP